MRLQGTQGPIPVELLEKMSRFSNIVKISMILGFFGQAFDKMLFVERVRGVPHRILVAKKKALALFFHLVCSEVVSDTGKTLSR